jgi:hypothetical protein
LERLHAVFREYGDAVAEARCQVLRTDEREREVAIFEYRIAGTRAESNRGRSWAWLNEMAFVAWLMVLFYTERVIHQSEAFNLLMSTKRQRVPRADMPAMVKCKHLGLCRGVVSFVVSAPNLLLRAGRFQLGGNCLLNF